jgi:hypothetical protein
MPKPFTATNSARTNKSSGPWTQPTPSKPRRSGRPTAPSHRLRRGGAFVIPPCACSRSLPEAAP